MAHNIDKASISLKKADSLLKKVQQMMTDNKYCIDIIQQNLAIIGLLKSTNLSLLEGHLNHCIKNATKEKNEKRIDEMMTELLKVIKTAQNK